MLKLIVRFFFILPLLITALFPWIQLSPLIKTDTQPYSFLLVIYALYIISLISLLSKNTRYSQLNKTQQYYLISSILAFFIVLTIPLIDTLDFDTLRGVYQYLYACIVFLFLFLVSFYYPSKKTIKFLYFLLLSSFSVWVFVGLYQYYVKKDFLTTLLNRAVVTDDRGVISLSCEPAYFAHVLLFYSIVFFLYNKRSLAYISFFLIIFLTKSSVVIAVGVAILIMIYLQKVTYKKLAIFFAISFLLLINMKTIVNSIENNSRIVHLAKKLVNHPESILYDGSLNIRLTHFYYSYHGFLNDFGIPHGVKSWPNYIDSRIGDIDFLFDSGTQETSRINSGIGGILFESGLLGFLLIFMTILILSSLAKSKKEKVLFVLIYILFFHTGYTYKLPFFYIMLYLLYIRKYYNAFTFTLPKPRRKTYV